TDSETFTLTVTSVNDAPVSNDISIIIPEDSSVLIEVSGEDVEGDSLSFEVVDFPQHGGLGPSFVVSIDAEGEGQTHSLNLGFLPFATDVYDDGIDIYAPPAPPPPAFDAALSWDGDRYYTQMINGSPDDLVEHVWDIQLQYGVDGEILLSWDPSSLDSLGSFILEDAFGGMMFSVDMSTQSELLLDNPAFTILKVRVTPAVFFEWVYTPEPEYVGEEEFTYRAFDGELYSLPSVVSIDVIPVNDPPLLSYIGSQETDEDVPLSIEISGTDQDQGTDLSFTAESDTSAVEAEIQDGILTLIPELNWHGSVMITVTVSDGFLSDSETFELTVNSVNDLPEI
ncbi:cadherin-like domain-containing protein, partial [bacterium]|nr:cadherin-like domain-containing protein [bacterium]